MGVIFKGKTNYGLLKVFIKLGNEINLKDYYQEYKKNKKETTENLITQIENQIKEMLTNLK
ncbi:MAG: hypothetical protein ACP5O4_02445 [bacterium]